ncbi:MAG: cell division protein ZapA [Acidobacteriota bacterium]
MARSRENLIQVEIYGQRYTLKGSDDRAYVESLAAHVDRRMREIAETTSTVDSLKVAVLAAVNVADEYFRLKLAGESVEDRLQNMSDKVDLLLSEVNDKD